MLTTDQDLERFLDDHQESRLESYKALLRIPSISALSEHAADCRATAEWIAADLRASGIEHVELAETGGHPVVYGDWLHAEGAPTVIVYCHYDVQPADPLGEWTSPPFDPTVRDVTLNCRYVYVPPFTMPITVARPCGRLSTSSSAPAASRSHSRTAGSWVSPPNIT